MERASQILSDTCLKQLFQLKQASTTQSFKILSYKNSFKYSLLHEGQIKIEILSPTSFAAYEGETVLPSINGPAISEARYTDFLLGATRVRAQYNDLLKAKNASVSSAWLLVTAYYCCFYSSIELLKLQNRIPLGFDVGDLAKIAPRATGSDAAAFFQKASLNFIGQPRANKLVFESSGDKPHLAAWKNLSTSFDKIFKDKDWPEIAIYKRILETTDTNPSRVRNNWNYKRPDYYSSSGEAYGSQFKKLVHNPKGARQWLENNAKHADHDDSSRIAALCELLAPSVIDAYDRIRVHD
jgi:hypothetical protein